MTRTSNRYRTPPGNASKQVRRDPASGAGRRMRCNASERGPFLIRQSLLQRRARAAACARCCNPPGCRGLRVQPAKTPELSKSGRASEAPAQMPGRSRIIQSRQGVRATEREPTDHGRSLKSFRARLDEIKRAVLSAALRWADPIQICQALLRPSWNGVSITAAESSCRGNCG
jgi:hypothetical protein